MLLRTPLAKTSVTGRILRFAVVGGMGAIVNTTALYLLYRWVRLPLLTASALAVELAVVHNYLLNDWWTFSVRAPSIRRFVKFNVSVLGGLAVNVFLVWLLALHLDVYFLLANGVGIGAAFAVNFLSSAGWVWGRRSR
ncbi:GtrA family protein [Streptomyces gobiensis]|uniref:GtrA family protein n=1 Tax=Streptomyces gobiensis TaxID=2875706 RepID=UPI001E63E9AA|nr:GtrA family protein [Streptomyces gobiensis]UGY90953.1 GtrA family protein [Streptomyces gobiensis]